MFIGWMGVETMWSHTAPECIDAFIYHHDTLRHHLVLTPDCLLGQRRMHSELRALMQCAIDCNAHEREYAHRHEFILAPSMWDQAYRRAQWRAQCAHPHVPAFHSGFIDHHVLPMNGRTGVAGGAPLRPRHGLYYEPGHMHVKLLLPDREGTCLCHEPWQLYAKPWVPRSETVPPTMAQAAHWTMLDAWHGMQRVGNGEWWLGEGVGLGLGCAARRTGLGGGKRLAGMRIWPSFDWVPKQQVMTKLVVSVALVLIMVCGAWVGGADEAATTPLAVAPPSQATFEQYPPYVTRYWLELLPTPLSSGENLIFSVQYESDDTLPEAINIYDDAGSIELRLRDDGIAPDKTNGDKKYSVYKKEDINAMVFDILRMEGVLQAKGTFLVFTGHVGNVIRYDDIVKFDENAFKAHQEVEISVHLKDGEVCDPELLKERSLFITDLSVVEDQTRTFNIVTEVGDLNGAWTFGTLMANMENGNHADGVRGFLKDWVRHWTVQQTVNGYVVEPRGDVMEHLIVPWLEKANGGVLPPGATWEEQWDATPAADIKGYAPFKLTAIVNRQDLRGNHAYAASPSNAGETRFIFTLIDPVTGKVPIHRDQTIVQQSNGIGFVDWRGLNVILEYGNPGTSCAAQHELAEAWLDLSSTTYEFGEPESNNAFKDALQAITDLVTLPNASPTNVNGSAINRVRTNEKIFGPGPILSGETIEEFWERADWEFRQFELNSVTHDFSMTPLTNNPDHTANFAPNIQEDTYGTSPQVTNSDLIDWIFDGHRLQVQHGNFNLPTNLLSGAGRVRREEVQYLDLEPGPFASAGGYDPLNESAQAKAIRQQLSLNTCAGCHAGETKTVFTHVNALAYAEPAKYWLATLDGASSIPQDPMLYPWGDLTVLQHDGMNNGETVDPLGGGGINFTTNGEVEPRSFFQGVSPFLTGRRYLDYPEPPDRWQDDKTDDDDIALPTSDATMLGLFHVSDPSNDGNVEFPFLANSRGSFNDLERRRSALCVFVNQSCSGGSLFPKSMVHLMGILSHAPLPLGSH